MATSWFWHRCRLLVIPLVAVALQLVVGTATPTAFAAEQQSGPHTWNVTVGVQTPNGAISGMIFTPNHIWVKQGDTVKWTVDAQEIHTVSFGEPPPPSGGGGNLPPIVNVFQQLLPLFATPAGGSTFTGAGFYNSGLMTTVPTAAGFPDAQQTYSLTINAPVGDYMFYCLVHGPMMSQMVTVIPDTQPYPFTQQQYDVQAAQQRAKVIAQGWGAYGSTQGLTHGDTVYAGSAVESGQADVMRFMHSNTVVKVGDEVTFTNLTGDPHTVTIGSEEAIPFGGLVESGNLQDVHLGDNVSSGVFGHLFGEAAGVDLPDSVSFRFAEPGIYHFFCIFHDYQGMVGTITVVG